MFHAVFLYTQNLVNGNSPDSLTKMQAYLSIRTHALEKGMSIGNVRVGFGITKALFLIRKLQVYKKRYGTDTFWEESYNIINEYVKFNVCNGADMQRVQLALDELGVVECNK